MISNEAIKIEKSDDKVSKAFMWSHATSINGGFMMIAATLGSYFSVYMTDTIGIPAATASAIMFIATLWDAINDPIMGTIADRTHTKWGRYRPYFTIFPVLMLIVSTLIFYNPPGLTMNQKVIYIGAIYICYGMLTTILTMPQMAILPTVTRDNGERNKVVAAGAGFCAFSFTVASTFTPQLTAIFGGNYVPLMFIYGVLGVISFWVLFATSKEKYLPKVEKRPIVHDLKRLLRHKELLPVLLVWCLASLGYGLMFSASVYYIMYYMVRPDLISAYMGVISIGALISMVVLMPIALKIFKTGQRNTDPLCGRRYHRRTARTMERRFQHTCHCAGRGHSLRPQLCNQPPFGGKRHKNPSNSQLGAVQGPRRSALHEYAHIQRGFDKISHGKSFTTGSTKEKAVI